MIVLYLIVLAITATVIVNTLIMAVFERTREIGILSAIGMKGGRIMAMFFAESSLLAVGGIIMGLILGGLLVAYASYQSAFIIGNMGMTGIMIGERIYAYLTLNDAITLTITAFIITLLAALYPALLAARMEPVEACAAENKRSRSINMEVTKVENVTRIYKIGKVETQALRGVNLSHRERRIHRPGRAFRLGQDHPAAADRLPGPAHQRAGVTSTARMSASSTATSAPICAAARSALSSSSLP